MSAPKISERLGSARRSARADRARARAPRYLFIAALAITSLVGMRTMVSPPSTQSIERSPAPASDESAQSFALEFARAYLSWGPGVSRERALRPFLSSDLDYDAGVSTRGRQRVRWAQVAADEPARGGGWTIVIAAAVTTQTAPLYLAVGVERRGGALALTGYPALVGAPRSAHAALPGRDDVASQTLRALGRRVVTNYLAANAQNLAADLAPSARVALPTLSARAGSIDSVQWAAGAGSGAIVVTVEAIDARRRRWTLAYELGLAGAHSARPTCTYVETAPASS